MSREMTMNNEPARTTPTVLAKVYQELCQLALKEAPICVSRGVIAQAPPRAAFTNDETSTIITKRSKHFGVTHSIIAGGGKFRDIHVPEGCWNPIAFCQLLLENEGDGGGKYDDQSLLQRELDYLTEKELELLTKYILVGVMNE